MTGFTLTEAQANVSFSVLGHWTSTEAGRGPWVVDPILEELAQLGSKRAPALREAFFTAVPGLSHVSRESVTERSQFLLKFGGNRKHANFGCSRFGCYRLGW